VAARDQPAVEHTGDIDDWLAMIASGRCVGITPESTITQYRRQGIAFRTLRDADPVPVWTIWRRQDPHPATHAAVALPRTCTAAYRCADQRVRRSRLGWWSCEASGAA
jgi:DNA-binding transcriptional LysR family regulator